MASALDRMLRSPRVATVLAAFGLAVALGGAIQSAALAIILGAATLFLVAQLLLYKAWVERTGGRNYEALTYKWEWDIDAPDGSHASLKKTMTVRYLSDTRVIAEMVRADNPPKFVNLKCTPGFIVDEFDAPGERWVIISLRGVRLRGQIETWDLERESLNAFRNPDEEWVSVDTPGLTRSLQMTVVLPPGRRCERAWVEQRSKHRHIELRPDTDIQTRADRTALVFSAIPPYRRDDRFTLRWQWTSA